MKLYEVSGPNTTFFCRTLKEARAMFEQKKAEGEYIDLAQVEVEISAERQIELLNGYWSNARYCIRDIDSYEPPYEEEAI